MGFFEVMAKCGHVGNKQYYRGLFYVKAENGRAAAAIVRMTPRVKHDHKDAIIAVAKIDYSAYKAGQAVSRLNPFLNCRNVQEQRVFLAEIMENVYSETDLNRHELCYNSDKSDKRAKRDAVRRYYRKMDKYRSINIGA